MTKRQIRLRRGIVLCGDEPRDSGAGLANVYQSSWVPGSEIL
jgi:hypothetical protein